MVKQVALSNDLEIPGGHPFEPYLPKKTVPLGAEQSTPAFNGLKFTHLSLIRYKFFLHSMHFKFSSHLLQFGVIFLS